MFRRLSSWRGEQVFIPAGTIFQSCRHKFSIFCLIQLIPVLGRPFIPLTRFLAGLSSVQLPCMFINHFVVIMTNETQTFNKQTNRKFERQIKKAANFIPLAQKSLKILILHKKTDHSSSSSFKKGAFPISLTNKQFLLHRYFNSDLFCTPVLNLPIYLLVKRFQPNSM